MVSKSQCALPRFASRRFRTKQFARCLQAPLLGRGGGEASLFLLQSYNIPTTPHSPFVPLRHRKEESFQSFFLVSVIQSEAPKNLIRADFTLPSSLFIPPKKVTRVNDFNKKSLIALNDFVRLRWAARTSRSSRLPTSPTPTSWPTA